MPEKNVGYWERPIRIAAGGALVGLSMIGRKSRLARVAEGVAGSELLYSGITGYCPMNEALGRDTYHGHRMRGLVPVPKASAPDVGFEEV